jgi:hypothetical protein
VTIWFNGALLFVVVAYIYPLTFLFANLVGVNGLPVGAGHAFSGRSRSPR